MCDRTLCDSGNRVPRVYVEEKKCGTCGEVKHRSAFGPHTNSYDGLHSYCRPCNERRKRLHRHRTGSQVGQRKRERLQRMEEGIAQMPTDPKAARPVELFAQLADEFCDPGF